MSQLYAVDRYGKRLRASGRGRGLCPACRGQVSATWRGGHHEWYHSRADRCPGAPDRWYERLLRALELEVPTVTRGTSFRLPTRLLVVDGRAADVHVSRIPPSGPWPRILATPCWGWLDAALRRAGCGVVVLDGGRLFLAVERDHDPVYRRSGALAGVDCAIWEGRHVALHDLAWHLRGGSLGAVPEHPLDTWPHSDDGAVPPC